MVKVSLVMAGSAAVLVGAIVLLVAIISRR